MSCPGCKLSVYRAAHLSLTHRRVHGVLWMCLGTSVIQWIIQCATMRNPSYFNSSARSAVSPPLPARGGDACDLWAGALCRADPIVQAQYSVLYKQDGGS